MPVILGSRLLRLKIAKALVHPENFDCQKAADDLLEVFKETD
jgi:hypothetical protein